MSQFIPPYNPVRTVQPPPLPEVIPCEPPRSAWRKRLMIAGMVVLMGSMLLNVALLLAFGVQGLGAYPADGPLATTVMTRGRGNQTVAVLNLVGMIDGEMTGLVEAFCRQVSCDDGVKAVVLRVDSPGGGVSACDQIYTMLKDLHDDADKTIVVSMGGMAASGGYYVSAPADWIVAEPTTITGSIGVLSTWPVLKGTFDKLGVQMMIVRSTGARAWKATMNYAEQPAPYQLEEIQSTIDAMHARFADIVQTERQGKVVTNKTRKTYTDADGKDFTVTETKPFNGQIFLADEAEKLGLIDDVGYFKDAVGEAARLAGLDRPRVVVYHPRRSVLEEIGLNSRPPAVDLKVLDELQTPKIMMLWKVSP